MARGDEIIKEREKKIIELAKQGVNPYAHKFDKKHSCLELQESYKKLKDDERSKDKAQTAGRLMIKRDIGKLIFATMQDISGQIQIILQRGETPDKVFELFKRLIDTGDFIGVKGTLMRTRRGELSILIKDLEVLTKAVLPLPEKFHGLVDKEERYRKRYVDLVMNPEVKEVFKKRAGVISAIREYLVSKDYIEVETPILQPIYGGGSAKPFESKLNALDMKVYMRISDELYLKRLIAGGYEKIFEFCKDFRNEGIDATHNPEFTLMETMCAYADYEDNMDLVEEMIEHVAKKVTGGTKVEYQGTKLDFKRPWKRIKLVDAIKKYADFDVEKASDDKLKKKLNELKVELPAFSRGAAIEEIFGKLVEHQLIQPTIVYDYPVETSGLAKPKESDLKYAERFEPYVNGWELGNVYSEGNDPELLRSYWESQEKIAKKDEEAQKKDEDFLNMLRVGMPPTSGVGIGIDRLVMLLTNSTSIRDVLFFPFMREDKK